MRLRYRIRVLQGFDGMVSARSERKGKTAATLGIGKAAARDGVIDSH
jgi:hypothetical protein